MAEAIVNARMGEKWQAYSAGVAGRIRSSQGTGERWLRSASSTWAARKAADEFRGVKFDLVVGPVMQPRIVPSGSEKVEKNHLGFSIPAEARGSEMEVLAVFRQVRDDMLAQIPELLGKYESGGGKNGR